VTFVTPSAAPTPRKYHGCNSTLPVSNKPLKPLLLAFGAGNLTGGLIVPFAAAQDTKIVVLNRTSSSPVALHAEASGGFSVSFDGAEPTLVPIDEFIWYDTVEGDRRLREIVGVHEQIIITTSVGNGQRQVQAFLSGLPRDLWAGRDVCVVPCENRVDPQWNSFSQRTGLTVHPDVLVDRICRRPDPSAPTIRAERFGEWIVEAPTGHSLAERCGATTVVDLAMFRRRKLYLVNGLQISMALLALDFTTEEVDATRTLGEFIATQTGELALQSLSYEYTVAFQWPYQGQIDPYVTLEYTEQCVERLRASTDRPLEIIIGGSGDPEKWKVGVLTKLDNRLTEPMNDYCTATGEFPEDTTLWEAWSALVEWLRHLR
jgi:hypothetical protein